jgi:hypothetical protein
MRRREAALEVLQRHVADGVIQIAAQYATIRKLAAQGSPTDLAELTLYALEKAQLKEQARLRRLAAKARQAPPGSFSSG